MQNSILSKKRFKEFNHYVDFISQSNPSDVSETLAVEPSLRWMVEVSWSGISIEEERTLFLSAHWKPWSAIIDSLLCNIKDGVRQVQELTWPTGSTDDPIDVGTAKEAHGLTTCTLYPVSIFLISLIVETVRGKLEGTFETLYGSYVTVPRTLK